MSQTETRVTAAPDNRFHANGRRRVSPTHRYNGQPRRPTQNTYSATRGVRLCPDGIHHPRRDALPAPWCVVSGACADEAICAECG